MTRKWKDSRGLTLVEMLCAVVILVLLGLLINTGLQLAVHSYQDVTAQEELELLAASLSDALADDLRYAKTPIKAASGDTLLEYHSERYNISGTTSTKLSIGKGEENGGKDKGQLYANDYRVLPSGAYGSGGGLCNRKERWYCGIDDYLQRGYETVYGGLDGEAGGGGSFCRGKLYRPTPES